MSAKDYAVRLSALSRWMISSESRHDLAMAVLYLNGHEKTTEQLEISLKQSSEAIERWAYWKDQAVRLGHFGQEPDFKEPTPTPNADGEK